jgi:two-component system CheB/CheR fusion protein
VGVGASAGGLEAFSKLVRKIPVDTRLALVLVQHLSPTHESHLPQILGSATTLPIHEARDRMRLEPGHIYVIPADARMAVVDGHLKVGHRPTDRSQYTPIDHFFESLASGYQERAIAVVLSGTASDGAAGLAAVKAAGGLTLVQDPGEAKFDGMPRAAIATGAVDLVLPVERMAAELTRLCDDSFVQSSFGAATPGLAPDGEHPPTADLRQLLQILRKTSDVDFTHYKEPTMMRRIYRRMALRRIVDLPAYVALLEADPKEAGDLYEDLLIHVTSFFREPEAFEALSKEVFPRLLAAHTDGPIRAWVPGCSSGEEVYSLAIALQESLGDRADSPPVQIFGTDVSQRMIDHARRGQFPEAIARAVTPGRLRRFFTRVDGGYRISKILRERCVFSRQDLTRDPPFSKLDLIVCRNLLIYLGYPLQRKVMAVFHYGLKPTGFLMLGRSETTAAYADLFSMLDKKHKIYSRRGTAAVAEIPFGRVALAPPSPGALRTRPSRLAPGREQAGEGSASAEVNRLILDRYGPPGVLVDGAFRIVRTRGRTGRYLELPAGEARLDLLQMARDGLVHGLRKALREAQEKEAHVRKEGLQIQFDGESLAVNLDVTPIGSGAEQRFLVLFEEPVHPARGERKRARAGRSERAGTAAHLEKELAANREYLQAIIEDLEGANEELQSANEEILSSNEELQSTNEELDTAREELQSTNEELNTLNEELRTRNDELSQVNGDLLNLLASVNIAIVMVGEDLKVRRFTPAAEKLLNLIPGDVGRPIGHIRPNVELSDVETLIGESISAVAAREREVTDGQGNVYSLRIRPYKSVDNKIDGAVLMLIDVSALKLARETGEAIMNSVGEPILMLNERLEIVRSNHAFREAFQVSAAETEGRFIYDVGAGQWDSPKLRTLLEEILPRRKNFEGFVVEREFPGLGRRKMVLDGRRIESGEPGGGVILLIIRDGLPNRTDAARGIHEA